MIEEKKDLLVLGIESSCDETAASVVRGGREVLSNVISSQIALHTLYGGVVPELASRKHIENIDTVLRQALREADVTLDQIDAIAVTYGPGLVGALLVGVAEAKAIAFAADKPLVGVNHIEGHVCANLIAHPELEPPFLCLIVSGGHTHLAYMKDYGQFEILGRTRDDAAGEAFDKVARVIGLGYPGGPKVDKTAKTGDPKAIDFKRVWLEKGSYDFSFSGLKTQALNYINQERMHGREVSVPDMCASYQAAIMDVIIQKAVDAALEFGGSPEGAAAQASASADVSAAGADEKTAAPKAAGNAAGADDAVKTAAPKAAGDAAGADDAVKTAAPKLVVAGGVAANSALREGLAKAATQHGIDLYIPDPVLCTDNGAMIGAAAYYKYRAEGPDDLTLDAYADLEM